MPIQIEPGLVGTNLVHAAVIGLFLLAITVPIALHTSRREQQPWLAGLVLGGLVLHLVGSVLQVVVVRIAYDNVADFHLYNGEGAILAQTWRNGTFTLAGLGLQESIPGTGTVSVITGMVYSVVGVDQLGGFFVFAWLSLLGVLAFYRAFRIAAPNGQSIRYAIAIFLLPSMFYWPAAAGKEAVMMLSLGLFALGAAKIFRAQWSGLVPMIGGTALGALIRPHEIALVFGAFCVAMLTRRVAQRSLATPVRWTVTFLVVLAGSVVLARVTVSFLGLTTFSASELTRALTEANEALQCEGAGCGSSHATWHPSPLYFPYDVYLVLLKPLPFEVSNATQAIAALENLTVLAFLLFSWRSLAAVPGQLRQAPFLLMCVVYSVGFMYIFSALGNVGLLARERTLLFPFLFVLCALPTLSRQERLRRSWRLFRPEDHPDPRIGRPSASETVETSAHTP